MQEPMRKEKEEVHQGLAFPDATNPTPLQADL